MDGPNPTESKIARDEGFIIRTRMNTVNGHSDQRDQARGFSDHLIEVRSESIDRESTWKIPDKII